MCKAGCDALHQKCITHAPYAQGNRQLGSNLPPFETCTHWTKPSAFPTLVQLTRFCWRSCCTHLVQPADKCCRHAKAIYMGLSPATSLTHSMWLGNITCVGVHTGQEPISWADLIVLSAKVAHVLAWTRQKVKRATVASGGSTIADAFGAAFPVPLGRVDATSADEPVKIPTQSASPAEVKVRQGQGT